MRERDVEDHFVAQVEKRGGETRKLKWIGRSHAPDRLALLPGRSFLAELKAPGKGARDGQVREHTRLRAAGIDVYVLDTIEKIDSLFKLFDRGLLPNEV